MLTLTTGLCLWYVAHLFPALAVSRRAGLIQRHGLRAYRAVFALWVVGALVLIVYGWRSTAPVAVYEPPAWGRAAAYVLGLPAFILFIAAKHTTNIKRWLRHPQLCGVILWSGAHLLANGDQRSLLLFSALGFWALLEIVLINRRTGAWIKPEKVTPARDAVTLLAGVVLYTVLLLLHPYLAGTKLV